MAVKAIRHLRQTNPFIGVLGLVLLVITATGCKQATDTVTDRADANDAGTNKPLASIASLSAEDAVLDETRQKEIWAAEHATHVLEHRFGTRFKKLLDDRDRTQLAKLFTADAKIQLIDQSDATATRISSIRETKTNADVSPRDATPENLVDWLVNVFQTLESGSKYSLRVLQIEPSTSTTSERQSWIANVLLTGKGRQGTEGTQQIQSKHIVEIGWADVEELESTACIKRWETKSVTVRETPKSLMTEVTKAAGLDEVPIQDNWRLPNNRPPQMIRFQMAVEDFDRDGMLDIAVSSAGNNFLLKFHAGKFRPVTSSVGIHATSRGEHVDISAGWLDYDNDNFPDLILGGRLYHNESGRQFVDGTDSSGLQFHPHHMGCAVADYDADGFNDVYFIYAHDRKPGPTTGKAWIGDDQSGGRNQLWKNNGDGTFTDATESAGIGGGKRQSFAATWLFADEDHLPDLYVANDFGTNSLFRNRGDGTFEDVSDESGTSDFATSMGVASGDLNNDGQAEIYVANMYSKMGRRIVGQVRQTDYPPGVYPRLQGACAGSRLYQLDSSIRKPASEFSLSAGVNQVGWAYAPAMADFNNDGLLDLYATCGFISVDRSKPDG